MKRMTSEPDACGRANQQALEMVGMDDVEGATPKELAQQQGQRWIDAKQFPDCRTRTQLAVRAHLSDPVNVDVGRHRS